MTRNLLLAALLATAPWAAVTAQETVAPAEPLAEEEAPAPKPLEERLVEIVDLAKQSSETEHRYNVETLSCGEFVHLTSTGADADRAVTAMLMVWAHGYHSGLKGLNFEARPVDAEGIVQLTRETVAECAKSPDTLFHVVVARLP